jgi:hypothetical protein
MTAVKKRLAEYRIRDLKAQLSAARARIAELEGEAELGRMVRAAVANTYRISIRKPLHCGYEVQVGSDGISTMHSLNAAVTEAMQRHSSHRAKTDHLIEARRTFQTHPHCSQQIIDRLRWWWELECRHDGLLFADTWDLMAELVLRIDDTPTLHAAMEVKTDEQ